MIKSLIALWKGRFCTVPHNSLWYSERNQSKIRVLYVSNGYAIFRFVEIHGHVQPNSDTYNVPKWFLFENYVMETQDDAR